MIAVAIAACRVGDFLTRPSAAAPGEPTPLVEMAALGYGLASRIQGART